MVDVYHELEFPYEVMTRVRTALKPGVRVALIEYRKEDPDVAIKEVHKMSVAQVKKEMALFPNLKFDELISKLPRQHVIIFKKVGAQSRR